MRFKYLVLPAVSAIVGCYVVRWLDRPPSSGSIRSAVPEGRIPGSAGESVGESAHGTTMKSPTEASPSDSSQEGGQGSAGCRANTGLADDRPNNAEQRTGNWITRSREPRQDIHAALRSPPGASREHNGRLPLSCPSRAVATSRWGGTSQEQARPSTRLELTYGSCA